MNQCHLSTPIFFWMRGMAEMISLQRFYWCGSKHSIMLKVSNTHHSRTWKVYQVNYHYSSFLRHKFSLC